MPEAKAADGSLIQRAVETAYAKVNLSLDVLDVRPDGFHNLRSVMQTVSLCDSLTFSLDNVDPSPKSPGLPDYSLIDRSIQLVRETVGSQESVTYSLIKRIPIGAGLGGGSSDAAAALRGVSRLLGADLSFPTLLELSERLGSDVPFFIRGGTALVEGRGERILSLPPAPTRWFVLVNGGVPVSTARVFTELKDEDRGDGRSTHRVVESLKSGLVEVGSNDLWPAAARVCPEIERLHEVFAAKVPSGRVMLSGSGGTLFAIFDSKQEAMAVEAELDGIVPWVYVAQSVDPMELEPTRR